jgi:hypothetical protein
MQLFKLEKYLLTFVFLATIIFTTCDYTAGLESVSTYFFFLYKKLFNLKRVIIIL